MSMQPESPLDEPGIVRVADWQRFPWLRAGFSTRQGGASTAYGASDLNLGWTASDPAEMVAGNRARFLRSAGGETSFELATVQQFHSAVICVIGPEHGVLATPQGKAVLQGDGLMTAEPGVMLGVQTADCVPVLLADTKKRVVAAIHAGWRGTLAHIVEHGVGDMRQRFGSEPEDLVAAIGPCIGACCFAVGEEVRYAFESEFAYAYSLFSKVYPTDAAPGHSHGGPQTHLDLVESNRRQLLDAGLHAESITAVGECTSCARLGNGNRKYFSHRGESGFTGRMLSVIGVAPR